MDVHDLLLRERDRAGNAQNDFVFVRDVTINANIGPDAWGRSKIQPVTVSTQIPFSIAKAGVEDSITHTLDYRKVYKVIRSFDTSDADADTKTFSSLVNLAEQVGQKLWTFASWIRLDLTAPKGLLHAHAVVLRYYSINWLALETGTSLPGSTLSVKAMHIPCIIGIGEHERVRKQPVVVDFAVFVPDFLTIERPIAELFDQTFKIFEASTFLTLEAFVTMFACHLTVDLGFHHVAVSAHKPSVFGMADGPGVQIVRSKEFFDAARPT